MSNGVPLPMAVGASGAVTIPTPLDPGNIAMRRTLIAMAFGGVGLAIGAALARAFPPTLTPPP
jgi:hypothetical protein